MPSKTTILTDKLPYLHNQFTGSHLQLYKLATLLSQQGRKVSILYTSPATISWHSNFNGIELIHCPVKARLGFIRKTWLSINTQLQNQQPDTLYTRGRSLHVFIASVWAKKHNKKHVWATNGEDSANKWKRMNHLWNSNRNILKKLLLTPPFFYEDLLIHKGIKSATTVINQTEHQKAELKRIWGKEGMVLPSIYMQNQNSEIKKENIVLWLANLSSGKNPEAFIEMVKTAPNSTYSFVMVGGSANKTYEHNIKQQATIAGIQFIGQVNLTEAENWISRSKILVNTSLPHAEGLPNTFIQAWMNHTAVISLHHNPNNWLADKGIGIYCNGNKNTMADRIESLLQNQEQQKEMMDKAYTFANNYFCGPDVTQKYLDIFTS